MNFTSRSWCWTISECATGPDVLIRSLIDTVAVHLPADSLGHVKGYVDFDGGSVFASSTLIPPGVNVQQTGEYLQGEMRIHLTMIFSNLNREVMAGALASALEKIRRHWKCRMHEGTDGTYTKQECV